MHTLEVAPGVGIALALPEGAREVAPPAMDLSAVPGAELTLARAFTAGSVHVYLGCARAPGWLWAEGLEGPILAAANAFVKKQLGLSTLEIAEAVKTDRIEQTFASAEARGKHILGTVGDDLTLCTLVCTAPDDACHTVLGASTTGRFDPPPEAGLFARTLALGMSYPAASLGGLAAMFIALTALLLWRRPRPRYP